MSVKLLESLEMQTGLPLDNRDIVTNIDQRNNISPTIRYIGMEVYVIEENKKYRLEEGIENFNWIEMKAIANANELITDPEHLTVSQTEKDTWSGKAEKIHSHAKKDIIDFPTALKNPTALSIQLNGETANVYDGSTAKSINITPSSIGAQVAGSYAAASHTHDDRYFTETEINNLLDGKAASSHGNHVPAIQDASNKVFLRNDNTWATVTPANIGAALSSHTHDDRYFTETEINNKLSGYQPKGSYAASSHTHTASQVSGLPTALKNPTALTISLNGTSQGAYDGSTAKSINITPASIGAQIAGSYASANHNHGGVYQPIGNYPTKTEVYTKSDVDKLINEINSKFKNYPVPVGGILLMYNTSNPAELYSGTTWELLATDKYLKTTTGTPLSTGGSNSFTIQKANLPNISIKVNAFNLTTKPHKHSVTGGYGYGSNRNEIKTKSDNTTYTSYTNEAGGENTGTASPSTEVLGNGTSISLNPTYITVRAWKRLS